MNVTNTDKFKMIGGGHQPVLVKEITECAPDTTKNIIDLTLGLGGHARKLIERCAPERYFGIDRDQETLRIAEQFLRPHFSQIYCHHNNFVIGLLHLKAQGVLADYIIADLGVSSMQFDQPKRGFSFRNDGPLDMRMDQNQKETAGNILQNADETYLRRIIQQYGEEKFAPSIARVIVAERNKGFLFNSTENFSEIVGRAIPKKFHSKKIHPATKTFQALRIAVNHELSQLETMLPLALSLLKTGGRMAIISFHSLEDRIVKTAFVNWEKPCVCPPLVPFCSCGKLPKIKRITKKPLRPSEEELENNKRSRSARLRIAQAL